MANVPCEVWVVIASHLSNSDLYACVLVSRAWYAYFHTLLFRTVTVNGQRRFNRFYALLEHTNLGQHVRRLDIDYCQITGDEMQHLQMMCPHVDSLRLGTAFCLKHPSYSATRIAASAFHLLSMYASQLTELRLSSFAFHATGDAVDDFSFLTDCPHLKSLTFNSTRSLCVASVEQIHSCCPSLGRLELSGLNLLSDHIDNASDVHQEIHLREIQLGYGGGWTRYASWLRYFALKYPSLETLALNNTYGIIMLREDEGLLSHRQQSYELLAHRCPRLRSVRIESVFLDPFLFDVLKDHKAALSAVAVHGRWRRPSMIISSVIECVRNTVQTLSMSIPPDQNVTELLILLGGCHQIVNLTLTSYVHPTKINLALDELLNRCKLLKILVIKSITASTSRSNTEIYHPLVSLTLEDSVFDQTVFDYLSRVCPKIHELSLFHCFRADASVYDEVKLHMPEHRFRSITIHGSRFSYSREKIRYFALNINGKENWYHMNRFKTRYDRDMATRARKLRHDEVNILKERIAAPSSFVPYTKKLRSSRGQAPGLGTDDIVYGFLSICCQSVSRLTINKIRLV